MADYLDPAIECADPPARRRAQGAALRAQVAHAYAGSPFYRRKLDAAGVRPQAIRGAGDLTRLPFTTKDELKANQQERAPWGDFLAVPLEECLRVHQTSATTGRPVLMLDTAEDWNALVGIYARSLYAYGIRRTDMAMPAFSFGPWIGFWLGFYALQRLGCLAFPSGGMATEQRIDALLNYPITVWGSTPSYALFVAEQAARRGIDLARQAQVRITWHTGEPGAGIPATRQRIEAAFGARCFDLPGLTEIAPWGFACGGRPGTVHIHEDFALAEVLEPETGRAVSPGGEGELVLTRLTHRAMPLLRYRTRDIVRLAEGSCPCGRTLLALDGGVLGRLDDMKKVRGVIVYPGRVEEIVRAHPGVQEFLLIIRRVEGLDDLLVRIDPSPDLVPERRADLRELVAKDLHVGLGIRATVEVTEPGALPRWDHKARRLRDDRTEVPF
ncbi:MAG TPA: AMP-binding protein [Candidatus Methylomirabilis sp.]|jgi:phenylacetate-CoA ligase